MPLEASTDLGQTTNPREKHFDILLLAALFNVEYLAAMRYNQERIFTPYGVSMLYKQCRIASLVKSDDSDDDRTFRGVASTFDKDQVSDVILPGAFKKTIRERHPLNQIKCLWQHWQPLGPLLEIEETKDGLMVFAKISKTAVGNDALELMRDKAVDSMSIGFDIVKDEYDHDNDIRYIKEVRLWEVSVVTFPANLKTRITEVKSLEGYTSWVRKNFIPGIDFKDMSTSAMPAVEAEIAESHVQVAESVNKHLEALKTQLEALVTRVDAMELGKSDTADIVQDSDADMQPGPSGSTELDNEPLVDGDVQKGADNPADEGQSFAEMLKGLTFGGEMKAAKPSSTSTILEALSRCKF